MINPLKLFLPDESRISALEQAVFPEGKEEDKWGIKDHIFGKNGGKGLWARLTVLEEFVYGHNGETPPQSAPQHCRLKDLEASTEKLWKEKADANAIWNKISEMENKLRDLEAENKKLREQLDTLKRQAREFDDSFHKAINDMLGKVQ